MKTIVTILTVFLSIQAMGQTTSGTINTAVTANEVTEINVNEINFLLTVDAPMDGAIVAIKNSLGSEVILEKVYGNVQLSLKDLQSGTYTLNVRNSAGVTIDEATLVVE